MSAPGQSHNGADLPKMSASWRAAEEQVQSGSPLGVAELSGILYMALGTFISAATLERYHEMAMSVSTLGLAHRAITGEWNLLIECYEHAALFAGWSLRRGVP